MQLNQSQTVQVLLEQRQILTPLLIERFQVLQQTPEEFKESLEGKAKENPFLNVRFVNRTSSVPSTLSNDEDISPLDIATYDESLLSVLTQQLDRQYVSKTDYEITLRLIDACDDRGLIPTYKTLKQALMAEFSVRERDVFKCLKLLQSFDPEGIGSRSVNECLWIQIDNHDLDDEDDRTILKKLVKDHLEAIANKGYRGICLALNISEEQLMTYISFIQTLNPVPARQFTRQATAAIQPSIRIDVTNGELAVTNFEQERMVVSLNSDMIAKLESSNDDELNKQFLQAKQWLEHFNKRQHLIQYCADAICKRQRLFFLEGDLNYMLPYLQKDLANDLGVSQSTVSRLVRSKYLECDHGVFLFNVFCPRQIYGKSVTQARQIIAHYLNQYPSLSDQKIADRLKSIGFPIARRTVTKYRHDMNIGTRNLRQKQSPKMMG